MGEGLEKHQSEWEERTKSMRTHEITDRAKKAKQQRKEEAAFKALVVSEDSNSTANEDKESKVLLSDSKRDKLQVLFRDRVEI